MQKPLPIPKIWWNLMKITLSQLLLIVLCSGMAIAHDTRAQEVLNRTITVAGEQLELSRILNDIEKQANVKFVYSTKIKSTQRLTVSLNNRRLSAVLDQILKPIEVTYEVIENRILLKKVKNEKEVLPNGDASSLELFRNVDRTITGTVSDEKGVGLPGVSILVKGTQRGTNTDANGNYRLSIPDDNIILVFSFVGYLSQEINVANQTSLTISLKPDTKSLEEVVVVGYGVQRKKDLTGAVATINSEMFKERKETQVAQALQGAMSGVMVTRSGANGAMGGATIRIRGITTIGSSDPLVVVDGVPVSDVNQVNPNDIENLTVLKDAASASIYGSRAAAGVILITTKRAKTDQASIQYSYENGFDTPTQLPDYMRAQRYMELVNELRWNDAGNGANRFPTFSQDLLTDYNQKHLSDPNRYPDTDWMALTLNKVAPREAHSISIVGGSKFVKSNASVRFEKVGGFYDNKNYNRIFVRSNNDFTINKLIGGTVDFNFKRTNTLDPTANTSATDLGTIGIDTRSNPSAATPLQRILISSPIYPAIWTDGRIADGKAGETYMLRLNMVALTESITTKLEDGLPLILNPLKD